MTINIDTLIQASRPSDAQIDAEFSRLDHQRILEQALGTGSTGSTTSTAVAPRRITQRRWLAPAAAVAALAIGGGALVTQQLHPLSLDVKNPSVTTTTSAANAPVPGNAVMALSNVALSASRQQAVVIGAQQYLHVKFVETQTGDSASQVTHDTYVSADGWTWRHDTGSQTRWMLYDATYTDKGSLPTDPAKLDATLRAGVGGNSADERVWKGIDEILVSNTASPALRAASITTLQNLALHPGSPENGKEGTATPKVSVKSITLNDGSQGVLATFSDAASRPGYTWTMTLDAQGNLVSDGQTSPGSTFVASYPVRELVNGLPADFASELGTQKVHVEK